MRIKVNPDLLDTNAKQIQTSCTELTALAGKLSTAMQSMDIEAQKIAPVRSTVEQAVKLINTHATQGNELAKLMTTKAALFRQIDTEGAKAIGAVPTNPSPVTPPVTPPLSFKNYDGKTPAPGTTSVSRGWPVTPPLTSNINQRDPRLYNEVLDQFAVPNNPRYKPTSSSTWCNIFVSDATKAMGAEIPHWVDSKGNPAKVAAAGAHELSANGVADWLRTSGTKNGWRAVSLDEAQRMANEGKPVVASWKNPNGIGHVAMLRPGDGSGKVMVAQAGATNSNAMNIKDAFSTAWTKKQLVVYVHD
jgi:hypothetical protein